MITPSIGRALRGLRPTPAEPADAYTPSLDPDVIERLIRALKRIEGFAELGAYDDVKRELKSLPIAARELPEVQLRVGRMLESLAKIDEAMALYARMERSALSQLGQVRCLARMERFDEARWLMDRVPFEAASVREFVEAREMLG
jgi:hypothetical protein